MLEQVTRFVRSLNNLAVGKDDDLVRIYCRSVSNSGLLPASHYSVMDNAPVYCGGRGNLPPEFQPQMQTTSLARMIIATAQLITQQGEKIYASAVPDAREMLQHIDRTFDAVIDRMLPWSRVQAWENSTLPAQENATLTAALSTDYTDDTQSLAPDDSCATDSEMQWFCQQIDTLIQRLGLSPDAEMRRQLISQLNGTEIIFPDTSLPAERRQERAHEDEMRRRTTLYEISLKNQRLAEDSVGARLIAWGDERNAESYALFITGKQLGSNMHLVAAGSMGLLSYFSRTLGEIITGEVFRCQPGETRAEWLMRVTSNWLALPETVAGRAFSFSIAAGPKPLKQLPGTVITHPPTGVTVQSLSSPGAKPALYIKTAAEYHPATLSAADGTVKLQSGEVIWFHQGSQQWRPFYRGNRHLHARCLTQIADNLISPAPGQKHVLASVRGEERGVWATPDGKQYLAIHSAAPDNPNNMNTGYVRGWLEGDFFTLHSSDDVLLYQQRVLQWQPTKQMWDSASSPFSLLKAAQDQVESRWLQQDIGPISTLTSVWQRPGLYRKDKRFFLRWGHNAQGTVEYLPLLAAEHSGQYRLAPPASDLIRLRYDELRQEWQFLTFTYPAFAGLPPAVKVQPARPWSADQAYDYYQGVYQGDGAIWIHSGTDKYGAAEYIRVTPDEEDAELFVLRAPNPQQDATDQLWLFRYGEDDEFVLEQQRLCQRRKRAGGDPCAGTSGRKTPGVAQAIPPGRRMSAEDRLWCEQHPRQSWEIVPDTDTPYQRDIKNLKYAARLSLMAPKQMPLASIASHAGITVRQLRAWLVKTSPKVESWFNDHPRHDGETAIEYALRLSRKQHQGVTIADIARHASVRELSLQLWLKRRPVSAKQWLASQPQQANESQLGYARRLARLPQCGASLADIATHAGVDVMKLRLSLKKVTPLQLEWLQRQTKYADEEALDYATRLGWLQREGLTTVAIAEHVGVNPYTLRFRLNRASPQAKTWLNDQPQFEQETPLAYAVRLLQMNQRLSVTPVTQRMIAIYAGVPEQRLVQWLSDERSRWFAMLPRQADEAIADVAQDVVIQQRNQRYAHRLAEQREQQHAGWLISDNDLAARAGVTLDSLQTVMASASGDSKIALLSPAEQASGWRPAYGALHLQLKQNPRLLVDAQDPTRSVTREVIGERIWIADIDAIVKNAPKGQQQQIKRRFIDFARELVNSDGAYQDTFWNSNGDKVEGPLSHYLDIFYDEQQPQLGRQIIAKRPIPALTPVGGYPGTMHATEASLMAECRKMGAQNVLTYLWGVRHGEGSVSAFQNANKLALINTARMRGQPAQGSNNIQVTYINNIIPFYFTREEISQGATLYVDYGENFLPDYFQQMTINNDIVRIVAASERTFFTIKGFADKKVIAIYGPAGEVKAVPGAVDNYILQEYLDNRGIIRYEAFGKKGKKKITARENDPYDLYYVMARVLNPQGGLDVINENMQKMMAAVAAVYPTEEVRIKSEFVPDISLTHERSR